MKMLRVGAAALNQTPLDWEGNTANIRLAIETDLLSLLQSEKPLWLRTGGVAALNHRLMA